MRRTIIIVLILMSTLVLTGCIKNESMQGCIEKAEWGKDFYYVYFEGGRRYKFNEGPPIPLNPGDEVIITTNSYYANNGNNEFVEVKRVEKGTSTSKNMTICPRCQYTIEN